MQKRLALCLIATLLGILLLFSLNLLIKPQEITINNITKEKLNEKIEITAKVVEVVDFPESSFQILYLRDKTGNITATSNSNRQLNITIGQIYTLIGKITEYNHTLQITIDRISRET
jgi:DNA/RNA endonuclease YhcR with UshA esterase domain